MKTQAIETTYGIIYSRNALIATDVALNMTPLSVKISASLSLSGCRPQIKDKDPINISINFYDIEFIKIYMLDDYPYEKYSSSSFDEVEEEHRSGNKRYILSTYDHVFDIVGKYEIMTE
ncbi:hypothetical protein [Xenorhabdus griffiniae]|uniref:Uncharacterized protein n=1 Tax=Xenorhabdus griffiniae TaxID=351672 RepID=A0ABY9XH39_9GAMM|nr:hypothetical protein [Xenorhabdus griffiniae]MBD1227506.1 hypothetical protein [Xenorhabdus griffiniae]MBE8586361.1 hypothetical protein [Xenorhabdus griffiniae]WMV72256.1 hypothetical protein QL128_19550 [Xenorhabdus griffiniae]WNH01934.1 hypothetical protein QL112_019560 [Xenorhabdus griffiniae]